MLRINNPPLGSLHPTSIYKPKNGKPMKVIVFASGGGGNLLAAIRSSKESLGLFKVALVVTDRFGIKALEIAREYGISVIARDFEKECGIWLECKGNLDMERQYFNNGIKFHNSILDEIKAIEKKEMEIFDLVVLSYHRWIHGNLLNYFSGRIINQHAGDLTVFKSDKKTRKYIGINPVLYALEDGQSKTRTSTFLVTEGHDTGEILCQGPWVRYTGSNILTADKALKHEIKQKEESDWPSLSFALTEISKGNFSVSKEQYYSDGSRLIFYKNKPVPYGGVDLSN